MAEITERLRRVMALDRAAKAIDFNEKWIDWGKLASRVDDIEVIFAELGLPQGARIGALLHNRPGHVASILAVLASSGWAFRLRSIFSMLA